MVRNNNRKRSGPKVAGPVQSETRGDPTALLNADGISHNVARLSLQAPELQPQPHPKDIDARNREKVYVYRKKWLGKCRRCHCPATDFYKDSFYYCDCGFFDGWEFECIAHFANAKQLNISIV